MNSSEPIILVKEEPFGFGYDVEVLPAPLGVGHNREFRGRSGAISYALQLQKTMGWRVRDLTAGGQARG